MSDAAATVRSSIVDGIAMAGIHPGPQFDAMINSIMCTMFARCVRWSVRKLAEEMDAAEGKARGHTFWRLRGPQGQHLADRSSLHDAQRLRKYEWARDAKIMRVTRRPKVKEQGTT